MGTTGVAIIIIALVIVVVVIAGSNAASRQQQEQRRAHIYAKYGRTETAERILNKNVWVGETSEQLRDSLGPPVDIDENVLKTKRKEIWKYAHKGAKRYGLKFTLENGVVVGWDEKM